MYASRWLATGLLGMAIATSSAAFADRGRGDDVKRGTHSESAHAAVNAQTAALATGSATAAAATTALEAAPQGSAPRRRERRELTDEQKARRLEHLTTGRAKWGAMLRQTGVREEMRMHMSRIARLRRIASVAKEAKKEAFVKRADAAIAKERARHEKAMEALRNQPGAMGQASAQTSGTAQASAVATAPSRATPAPSSSNAGERR